jgi:ABC-type Fe3+-hydroxamate transport system substrate-binding protein
VPRRIVSLVPSVTETLLAWGVSPVAVTRFCEAPGLPTVGGTKSPDIPAIERLSPDLVVMDTEENRAEDAAALEAAGVRVHATSVRAVADVAPTLSALAAALGCPVPGPSPLPRAALRLRAWVPIWRRPWMSVNGQTYGSSLLTAVGIVNVCEAYPDPYPVVELAEAAGLHPDVVLAPSEPYRFAARHRAELETVAPVVFVDGQDLFWWGSRTPKALHRLGELAADLASR